MKFFRSRVALAAIRNQTTDKNFTRVEMPILDRSNLIKRSGFKQGEKAPYASHDVFTYPADYKPWTFNYKGNGLFYGMLALLTYSYIQYEKEYLIRTGRRERPADKLYYRP